MSDKFIYIHNDDKQNYPFFRLKLGVKMFVKCLKTQLNEPTNLNSKSKSPQNCYYKQIRKRYYKTAGTSLINTP